MGFTILSISISLVAVFIPIFFMPGVIGLLFHEFAAVVSLAIPVSALVSLTLIPMLCARFLSAENVPVDESQHAYGEQPAPAHRPAQRRTLGLRATQWFEDLFEFSLHAYARGLDWCLAHRRTVLAVAGLTFVLTAVLFAAIPKGFFPEEDIGQIGQCRRPAGHLLRRHGRAPARRSRTHARQSGGQEHRGVDRRRPVAGHQHRAHVRRAQAAR